MSTNVLEAIPGVQPEQGKLLMRIEWFETPTRGDDANVPPKGAGKASKSGPWESIWDLSLATWLSL